MPDYITYRKSISDELLSIKDRVRNFIGSAHWGQDGAYKESILKDLLVKHLPANVNIGTGFVINNNQVSTQIDIIVYNNNPVLFKCNDFVVVSSESVLAIIEVKTKLDYQNYSDAINKSHANGDLIGRPIFNGIFSYEAGFDMERNYNEGLKQALRQCPGLLNNISIGKDYFIKYWDSEFFPNICNDNLYRTYKLKDLSFGYFIGNLVEDVHIMMTGKAIDTESRKVLYPENKENYKLNPDIII